jgi:hypothetical protein
MALSPLCLGVGINPFKGKAPFFLHLYKFTQDILHYPIIHHKQLLTVKPLWKSVMIREVPD